MYVDGPRIRKLKQAHHLGPSSPTSRFRRRACPTTIPSPSRSRRRRPPLPPPSGPTAHRRRPPTPDPEEAEPRRWGWWSSGRSGLSPRSPTRSFPPRPSPPCSSSLTSPRGLRRTRPGPRPPLTWPPAPSSGSAAPSSSSSDSPPVSSRPACPPPISWLCRPGVPQLIVCCLCSGWGDPVRVRGGWVRAVWAWQGADGNAPCRYRWSGAFPRCHFWRRLWQNVSWSHLCLNRVIN